jgi:ABC-2 type transport system ATP-binding protein
LRSVRLRDQLVYLGQMCGRGAKDMTRGLDTWLERLSLAKRAADRLDPLSHGNQQRVQLIAALVNEPGRQGVVQPAPRDHPDPAATR